MFISLGVDCGTATVFKSLNIRKVSLPFDWVVTYEGVTDIIANDFNGYLPILNNDCYEKMDKNNGVLFLHDKFPEDIEKIKRRIQRFKSLIESNNEKLIFVRKSHGEHHHREHNNIVDDIDDAINLDTLLKNKYPLLEYEINVILICDICFTNNKKDYNISENIKIHNIARPYPSNINVTNPDYFDHLCKNIFGIN